MVRRFTWHSKTCSISSCWNLLGPMCLDLNGCRGGAMWSKKALLSRSPVCKFFRWCFCWRQGASRPRFCSSFSIVQTIFFFQKMFQNLVKKCHLETTRRQLGDPKSKWTTLAGGRSVYGDFFKCAMSWYFIGCYTVEGGCYCNLRRIVRCSRADPENLIIDMTLIWKISSMENYDQIYFLSQFFSWQRNFHSTNQLDLLYYESVDSLFSIQFLLDLS